MLLNFLKTALRFLFKNKGYSAINVMGLSLGLAAFILLTLFVEKEFSYDEFYSQKDRIYQVFLSDTTDNRSNKPFPQTMAPMGPLMVDQVPEVVDQVRFGKMYDKVLKVGQQKFLTSRLYYTDEAAIDFFDIKSVSGVLSFGLDDLLISQSEAIKLFGSAQNAIGQDVEIVDFKKFTIAGVFQDMPENTHLNVSYLFSFENANDAFFSGDSYFINKKVTDWGVVSAFPLYIKLSESGLDLAAVKKKMEVALEPHQKRLVIELVRLDDIYFSEYNNSYFERGGERTTAQLYLLIAFIIVTVAIINYMNLATARYSKRSKEVGIRKTVGSHRWQMAGQFFLESMVLTFVSMVLAVCLVEAVAPLFSSYLGKTIDLDYSQPITYLFLFGLVLVVGFLAGIYPSVYLSRFNPIQVLSGKITQGKSGSVFRKVLVGFQFFICLGLISVTLIVLGQFRHMSTIDLGFDEEQVLGVALKDKNLSENYEAFKAELLKNPSVQSVSGTSYSVFNGNTSFYVRPEGKEEDMAVTLMNVEPEFLTNLGIEMVSGSHFNELEVNESQKRIIINASAQEAFGWDEPLEKKLLNRQVVGVSKDFIYGSAKTAIEPLMIMTSESGFEYAYIKLGNGNVRAAMDHVESVFNTFSKEYPLEYTFLDDVFAKKYEKEEKLSQIFSAFTFLAIIVSGLGILGLSIFIAESRIKEIGIRKVLGARTAQIVWLLNSHITLLIVLVSIITLPLVYYFMNQWLEEFSFRISITAATLLMPLALLLLVVWSILIYQSLKSAKANPVKALRTE